jgi:hypothetical protein
MLTVVYDEKNGIVITTACGLASIVQFRVYLPAVTALLRRSRARHGRSLHLVDATDNPVQAKDTFDFMSDATERNGRDDDCCAVVLQSTLARLQINRMPNGLGKRFFSNRDDARDWLLAQVGDLEERRRARL